VRVLANGFNAHRRSTRLELDYISGLKFHLSLHLFRHYRTGRLADILSAMADLDGLVKRDIVVESIKAEIEKASPTQKQRIFEAIALAALGSIPWIGGVLAAAATYKFGSTDIQRDELFKQWLDEHQAKLQMLRSTLNEMSGRLEGLGSEIEERISSEQYLALVRKAFRQWDEADTEEKRRLLVNLITNAAGVRIVSDDILRLFLDWLDRYHEFHFAVIREVYKNKGPTRYDIWVAVYGENVPQDSSADADLYKLLMRDLNIGEVIRIARETDGFGRFKAKPRAPRRASGAGVLESAFEDTKPWVLTELGKQFVHYTMTEAVARIEAKPAEEARGPVQA
jgi:hypothetical protein